MINEAFILISIKFSEFLNALFLELTSKLSKYTEISNYVIKQIDE